MSHSRGTTRGPATLKALIAMAIASVVVLAMPCSAQEAVRPAERQDTPGRPPAAEAQTGQPASQINVNWFYGSYIPKDVPIEPLNGRQRASLYLRQTYTTYGIYIKSALFTVHDQIHNTNPAWGKGWDGFAKRLGTRQAQFVVQNSIASLGDGLLGWEPRYDRCRCDAFWARTRHALARNFVTYASNERSLRPQVMPYVGAFAGGALATTWEPDDPSWRIRGYQAAIAQVLVGMAVNWIGEFAPEIGGVLHKKHKAPEGGR